MGTVVDLSQVQKNHTSSTPWSYIRLTSALYQLCRDRVSDFFAIRCFEKPKHTNITGLELVRCI